MRKKDYIMEDEDHDFGLINVRRRARFTGVSCNGEVFIPHPSLALVKFWQGRTELALRLLCVVLSGATLVASVSFLSALDFPGTKNDAIESGRIEARKVTTWSICTASVTLFVQLLAILGRFTNVQCTTSHSSLFHILDVISSVVSTAAYFTLTVPLLVYSGHISSYQKDMPYEDPMIHYDLLKMRSYTTVILCSVSMAAFLCLSVWMAIYISFNWERKMARYSQLHNRNENQ